MSITYLRIYPEYGATSFSQFAKKRILIFDAARERFSTSVGDRWRRIDPAFRANFDVVIFRGRDLRFISELSKDPILLAEFSRRPGIGCCPVKVGKEPQLVDVDGWVNPRTAPLTIDLFRQVEIESLLTHSNAIFKGADHHFILPSGRHSSSFIRFGDALSDAVNISRLIDWVMPYITKETVILGDSGSLMSLLLSIKLRAKDIGWDIAVRTAARYPDDEEEFLDSLREVISRTPSSGRILFLISVNSSGRFLRLFKRETTPSNNVVAIVNTGAEFEEGAVLSKMHIETWDVNYRGDCKECFSSDTIGIDPRTYERLPRLKWKRIPLSNHIASRNREFWEIVDRTGAVRFHTNAEYPEGIAKVRHHAVYLDMAKLLQDKSFESVTIEHLRRRGRPSYVLVPRHQNSELLKKLARKAFPGARIGIRIHAKLRLELLSTPQDRPIIVLDDSAIEGRTLIGLREAIYQALRPHSRKLIAFVVVARTPDERTLNDIAECYRDKNGRQLYSAFRCLLPTGPDCPWCQEMEQISRRGASLPKSLHDLVAKRRRMLAGELSTPPLLLAEVSQTTPTTAGSFFGDLGAAAAFGAACNATQELRSELSREGGGLVINIVDLPKAITRYFDSVFLAGILRTLKRSEIKPSGQDSLIFDAIEMKRSSGVSPVTLAELLWAAIVGKVPAQAVRSLATTLGNSKEGEYLKALLNES